MLHTRLDNNNTLHHLQSQDSDTSERLDALNQRPISVGNTIPDRSASRVHVVTGCHIPDSIPHFGWITTLCWPVWDNEEQHVLGWRRGDGGDVVVDKVE